MEKNKTFIFTVSPDLSYDKLKTIYLNLPEDTKFAIQNNVNFNIDKDYDIEKDYSIFTIIDDPDGYYKKFIENAHLGNNVLSYQCVYNYIIIFIHHVLVPKSYLGTIDYINQKITNNIILLKIDTPNKKITSVIKINKILGSKCYDIENYTISNDNYNNISCKCFNGVTNYNVFSASELQITTKIYICNIANEDEEAAKVFNTYKAYIINKLTGISHLSFNRDYLHMLLYNPQDYINTVFLQIDKKDTDNTITLSYNLGDLDKTLIENYLTNDEGFYKTLKNLLKH